MFRKRCAGKRKRFKDKSLKIGLLGRKVRGASFGVLAGRIHDKLPVLVFIFPRARDPRTKFFSVLSRGTCVDSLPPPPPPTICRSHTLAITLRTCFTVREKDGFLRFVDEMVRDDEQPPRAVQHEARYLAKSSCALVNSENILPDIYSLDQNRSLCFVHLVESSLRLIRNVRSVIHN